MDVVEEAELEVEVDHLDLKNGGLACSHCNKWFKNSTQMKNHLWRHTGEKPFHCDVCGARFTQQGNLKAHLRIHTGERPFQCSICHSRFTQRSNMKAHMKIHSGEKPYQCPKCQATFRQQTNLKTHMTIHTGERPYSCQICGKSFTQKSNLKAHVERVHVAKKQTTNHYEGANAVQLIQDVDGNLLNIGNVVYAKRPEKTYIVPRNQQIYVEDRLDENTATVEISIPDPRMTFEHSIFSKSQVRNHDPLMENQLKIEINECEACYECVYCHFVFESVEELRTHKCPGPAVYECKKCSAVVANASLFSQHKCAKRRCAICGMCFNNKVTLIMHYSNHPLPFIPSRKRHIRRKRNKIYPIFKIEKHPIFQKTLPSPRKSPRKRQEQSPAKSPSKKEQFVGKFPCCVCSKKFNRKIQRNNHHKIHKNKKLPCGKCGNLELESIGQFVFHRRSHNEHFRCTVCKKVFKTLSDLRLHEKSFKPSKTRLSRHYGISLKHFKRCQKREICKNARAAKIEPVQSNADLNFIESQFDDQIELEVNSKVLSPKKDPGPIYMCNDCRAYFDSLEKIKAHMPTHLKPRKLAPVENRNVFVISEGIFNEPVVQIETDEENEL